MSDHLDDYRCKHCGYDISVEPPRDTNCSHIYYPESCAVCKPKKNEIVVNGDQLHELLVTLRETKALLRHTIETAIERHNLKHRIQQIENILNQRENFVLRELEGARGRLAQLQLKKKIFEEEAS